jgi:lysophospholipase L1-like esterase
MKAAFIFFISASIALAQVDENNVNEWFTNCKATGADIGVHNAGTAIDATANWPSVPTDDEVKTYVAIRHGLGHNVSFSSQTLNYLNMLIARATAKSVTIPTGIRIMTEGESTTAGTSTWAYNAWPERLVRLPNWVGSGIMVNQATGSQTIANIASQYTAQIFPFRPGQGGITEAWLIVMIGIADAGANRTAAQMIADVESYITTANGHGFTTVLCTTMYNSSYTAGQKQAILDLNIAIMASTVPDHVVDTVSAIGQPDIVPANYADAVHPNGTGYDAIAGAINSAITP